MFVYVTTQRKEMNMIRKLLCALSLMTFGFVAEADDLAVNLKVYDAALHSVVGDIKKAEILGTGFTWSEGPVWDAENKRLYFSDVPGNKLYSWSREHGLAVEQDPSGVAAGAKGYRTLGTNGLIMANVADSIIAANHGSRSLQLINVKTWERKELVTHYKGKRFSSPNDVVYGSDGSLYFTDPPYGLEGLDASPIKEISFNGVYRLAVDGSISLIDDSINLPNGIALSPDEKWLYVPVSDAEHPRVIRYGRGDDGTYGDGKIWFDAQPYLKDGALGKPDGMVVTKAGNIFVTGPGGIFIINPDSKLLGVIELDRAAANCTLSDDEKTLFITAHDLLLGVDISRMP